MSPVTRSYYNDSHKKVMEQFIQHVHDEFDHDMNSEEHKAAGTGTCRKCSALRVLNGHPYFRLGDTAL